MSQLPIDLDAEAIQFEGHWFTRDELARRIKAMLDSGDFQVGKPSQALEQLTATLSSLRTLAFRATPDLAEALQQAATRQGRSPGQIIRQAISDYLGVPVLKEGTQTTKTTPLPERQGRRPTEPEMPAVALPGPPATDLKTTQPMPVIAGPGALKAATIQVHPVAPGDKPAIVTEEASPEEAASAVSLTPKPRTDEDIERNWFGR